MSRPCTWEGCGQQATVESRDSAGEIWADLCAAHEKQLCDAAAGNSTPALIRVWIKAQGGPTKTAKSMLRKEP